MIKDRSIDSNILATLHSNEKEKGHDPQFKYQGIVYQALIMCSIYSVDSIPF